MWGELCAENSLVGIVPGTLVESHRDAEKDEDKLLNVCYFIDHEGNVAGKYVKKNLWYVSSISLLHGNTRLANTFQIQGP
jgi:predicted amidohydrolase